MAEWRSYKPATPNESSSSSLISVMIAKDQLADEFPYTLHRPFIATRVLSVLDRVANQISTIPTEERTISEPSTVGMEPRASFQGIGGRR